MARCLSALLASLLLLCPLAAFAQDEDPYLALRAQDIRLGAIADRILVGNVHLCRMTMPTTGMLLHSADQYSAQQPQWFANGPVAIAAVLPGSAAETAGIVANDGLAQVESTRLDAISPLDAAPLRDSVFAHIATSPKDAPIGLVIQRGAEVLHFSLDAPLGCRVLVEVLATNDSIARSDGRVVQISYGMADRLTNEQLAAVFAHELAHAVLEHRRRLEEAGVVGGLFGELGRNRTLSRQVEVEADRLSVHLLANAGFDPEIAPRFWRSDAGRRASGGIFRSRIYPSRESRAGSLDQEIAAYLNNQSQPSQAEHLIAWRDQPFPED